MSIPHRTRIYHRQWSQLGFILETPCSIVNNNRYLVLYDNFTSFYHSPTEFQLCLCQDFARHMSTLDNSDLRDYYHQAFESARTMSNEVSLSRGQIIRVRKFGRQYHNARIIDEDCSLIEICFYERKSQLKLWIYRYSSMIDFSSLSSSSSSESLPIDDYCRRVRTRKRKSHHHRHPVSEGRHSVQSHCMIEENGNDCLSNKMKRTVPKPNFSLSLILCFCL